MKILLPILCWLLPADTLAQAKDSIYTSTINTLIMDSLIIQHPKPEILTSGFFDIVNNGQVNAAARLVRLSVGEPGKFSIPLSVYSGVSSNNFQNQLIPGGHQSNEHLVNSFINPLSGLANIGLEGITYFNNHQVKVTRSGVLYHSGVRILTGYRTGPLSDPATGQPVNFLNSFGALGLYIQTGAWEKNNSKNLGVFWLAGRYIICVSGAKQLREIIPGLQSGGWYHGWSFGWGVDITSLLNIKVLYYKYVKQPEINYLLPIYQFSFNYSLR